MLSLALLELISVTALLYSLLLVFVQFASLQVMALFFTWTVIVGMLYFYGHSRAKGVRLSALLLLLPLYFYRSATALIFFLITVPLLLMYLERFLLRGSYDNYVDNFRKVAVVYPVAMFLRWMAPEFGAAINHSAPFIFTYFLSAILLIRSVRHVEAGMDLQRLQGTNFHYLLTIAAVFLLATLEQVRQLAKQTVSGLLSLFFLPVVLCLRLLGWVLSLLSDWSMGRRLDWLKPRELPGQGNLGEMPPSLVEGAPSALWEKIIEGLQATFIALLIAGAVYILYRLLLRGGREHYQGVDYVEEREFLIRRGPRQQRRIRWWERLPRDPAGQVRFYYRRFLQKLQARQVAIHKADTTLEVQQRAEAVFTHLPQEIRDIYIASRYGEKAVDVETVKEMERLVRELGE